MPTYLDTNGLYVPPSRNGHRRSEAEHALTVDLLESRIADLEARIHEAGWLKLDGLGGREFGRDTLAELTDLARVNYLKNPLIKRAVEVGALYVWGQDLSVSAADAGVQAVVDRFWADNARVLTGQQASRLLEVELQVTGNVFLALFADRTTGRVRVRTVPMEDIREIVTNPDDRYEPWYYKRVWHEQPLGSETAQRMVAYYPDWEYAPDTKPASIGGVSVRWDAPMRHVKVGAFPHWRWGVSEVYAALDWARAYKELLEDDATRSRALARFAWRLTMPGGAPAVAAAKTKLGTTLGTTGGPGTETNPPPTVGSTFIGDQAVGLDPIRVAGTMPPVDHSRPARLMASAALGIADHFFDADVGNHATASTLDRPTELKYGERRQLWRDVFTGLIQWAIDRDIAAQGGLLRGQPDDEARRVELSFPDLLERSVTERVQAIVDAATLRGQPLAGTIPADTVSRLVLVALGVEDVDGELDKLAGDGEPVAREAFVAALRDVQEAARALAR